MPGSSALPVLPLFPDNTLPPLVLLRQWLRGAAEQGDAVGCEKLPHGNGVLPELLALASFKTLCIFRDDLPRRFIWSSPNGDSITVDNRAIEGEVSGDLPQLQGHLPPCPGGQAQARIIDRVLRRVEMARLADVNAVLGANMGADWRPALAALSYAGAPPPIRTKSVAHEDGPMRVWNPLPFPRRCVAALPLDGEAPPWAVVDQRGAKHPVQVVEGPIGEQWLTELQLGPLEVVDLVPYDQPTGGEYWEVTKKVLDNGWVRAEFNQQGGITRCCFDGIFIDVDEAIGQPLIDGKKPSVTPSIRPLESGPSRGRLLVSYDDPAGHLRITYTLHAHDDILQVAVTWNPLRDAEVVMEHPLQHAGNSIEACADVCSHTIDLNTASSQQLRQELRGLRWLRAGHAEQSLALVGQRPTTIIPQNLQVVVTDGCVYGLCGGKRSGSQLSLGEAAIALSVPGRHAGFAEVSAPVFHLGDHHDLTALWCAKPDEWKLEITFVEQQGRSGQVELFPASHLQAFDEARVVDADGNKISALRKNKEGDAWLVPFKPHDLLVVRIR